MIDDYYFRDIVSAIEKVLYYERGKGSYFRSTMVGTDFINRKSIKGKTAEDAIESCIKVLREDEVIKKASYKKEKKGTLFTFEMEGCIHLPVEALLNKEGIPAFICPPTNMILCKIREMTDLAVEIADITVNQGDKKCIIRVVVFNQE